MDKQDIIDGLDVILGRRGEKITQGDILIVEAAIMALAKAKPPEGGGFLPVGMVAGNGEFTVYNVQLPEGDHVLYIERSKPQGDRK